MGDLELATNCNNFIIFFEGREGTTALVDILNNFKQIAIVRQVGSRGWEPFDYHNCGSMSLTNFQQCLGMIYGDEPLDWDKLNYIYTQTAKNSLEVFERSKSKSIGCKMRFSPPNKELRHQQQEFRKYKQEFKQLMFKILKEYDITAFVAIRQDILRRSLSKYHGDGFKRNGHLQFKLATGKIKREDIPKVNVDCEELEKDIIKEERKLQEKKLLLEKFRHLGIKTYPLLYEDFCADTFSYLENFCQKLGISYSSDDITNALNQGTSFEKVHSEDISEFVINHEEVLEKFGDRYLAWT